MLPQLACLAAFSSKDTSPDYELTMFFSWSVFFSCAILFVQNFRYKDLAMALVIGLSGFRIFDIVMGLPPLAKAGYFLGSFIVTIFAGLSVFLKIPRLLLKQSYWLAAISVIISLLQMNGVIWAQKRGSAIDDKGLSSVKAIFQDVDETDSPGLLQTRPDGFAHANNLTSQILMYVYALWFFYYTVETGLPRASAFGLFVISLSCAVTGGKVIVFGITMVTIVSYLFVKQVEKKSVIKALQITAGAYLLYFLVFPGFFILNFNWDMFIFNISGRIVNYGVNAEVEDVVTPLADLLISLGSDKYISTAYMISESEKQLLGTDASSGISALGKILPVVSLGLLLAIFLWKIEEWRLGRFYIYNLRAGSIIMAVALLSCLFGGPFYQTVWYTFFASLALAPIFCRHFNDDFIRSVSGRPHLMGTSVGESNRQLSV